MKEPIKPKKPIKPIPPNKFQKYHNHVIDVTNLFSIYNYYDNHGDEISQEEFEKEMNSSNEDDHFSYSVETGKMVPSIKEILAEIPSDISFDNIYINLNLGYDSGRNYECRPFKSINLIYETPFDYEKELNTYNKSLDQYNFSLSKYNDDMKKYKLEMEKYSIFKAEEKIKKKKLSLEKQLAELNK